MILKSDVERAYQGLQSWLQLPTPIEYCPWLSQESGAEVYLKIEIFRETRTFKVRGAFNYLSQLTPEERRRGVITASGGNHALAVAYAAYRMGCPCTVVMTVMAPKNIAEMCRAYGAEVIIQGQLYDESELVARRLAEERHLSFVPAFDHTAIIAGQGTIGLELHQQLPDCDCVIVPVGGGGLIAGIGAYYADVQAATRVVGAEPAGAAAMYESLRAGARVHLANPASKWAEKLMPRAIGELNLAIAAQVVDRVIPVPDGAIADAVRRFLANSNLLVEGSAAIAAAALLQEKERFAGKKVAMVISGGNVNLPLLAATLADGRA